MKRIPSILTALSLLCLSYANAQDKILELGLTTFQSCIACHGPDGKGVKAGDLVMAPSLLDSEFVKGDHPDLLTAIVLKGIHKEDNQYIQAMLALEEALNDEQIAALIAYVTHNFGGARRSPSATQVAKWRKENKGKTDPWLRDDLVDMLKVANAPKLVSNLTYKLYEGKWEELPEFSKLTPVKTGKLEKGLITLAPAAKMKKDGYGMVFDGTITLPEGGEFKFGVSSDDGSAFNFDGETIVGNDGIHPVSTQQLKYEVDPGEHTFQILYFDHGGNQYLSAYIDAGKLGKIWLSEQQSNAKKKGKPTYLPIHLTSHAPNEAIVHRAFLPDAKPRAIGVGYPGALNLVWDADLLNLAYVYRGEFMNVSSHWNGRGSGSKPLGQDTVKVAQGLPFQILESLDEVWQPFSEATIPYERDTPDPKKEITFNIKHPDYQFRGYRLDENRFPTFQYDYRALNVTDRFDTETIKGVDSLVRTLTTSGKADENAYFRIASSGSQEEKDGWIDVGNNMSIQIKGASPVIRQVEEGKETLILLESDSTLVITYRWNQPLPAASANSAAE